MWVCLCNAISDKMLKEDPSLIEKVGTNCGKCKENKTYENTSNRVVLQRQSLRSQSPTGQNKI